MSVEEVARKSRGVELLGHSSLSSTQIHPLDAGHFAWEQAAEEYGRLVVDWITGGYRRVAAR
jgi:hypothetical protein